jgi:hypothetical protein
MDRVDWWMILAVAAEMKKMIESETAGSFGWNTGL